MLFLKEKLLEKLDEKSPQIQLVALNDRGEPVGFLEMKACNILTRTNQLRAHIIQWIGDVRKSGAVDFEINFVSEV